MTRAPKIKLAGFAALPPALPQLVELQHYRQRIVAALAMRPTPIAPVPASQTPIADAVLAAAHDDAVLELEAAADLEVPADAVAGDDQAPPEAANVQDPEGDLALQLQDPESQASQLALLRRLAAARYGAYRTETGFSIGGGGGPAIAQATIDVLIAGGWVHDEPSGGRLGSVKISADGRARLRAVAQGAA